MDGDGRNPVPDAQLDAGQQVPVERVDAARAEQADEVEGAARSGGAWLQSSTKGGSW